MSMRGYRQPPALAYQDPHGLNGQWDPVHDAGNACSAARDIKKDLERGERFRAHSFELACAQIDIEHRPTKTGMERMNRTLKEATVRRYYYDSHDRLRAHLAVFVDAYNFGKRLKTLKGLTPFENIVKCWTERAEPVQL